MTITYPAIFTHDGESYNVEFPDLSGCLTFGNTIEEAFFNAKEALAGYAASVLERGGNLPEASSFAAVHTPDGGSVQLIDTKPAYTQASVKKTLTIPYWLNKRAEEAHAPYSKILQDGLKTYLGLS